MHLGKYRSSYIYCGQLFVFFSQLADRIFSDCRLGLGEEQPAELQAWLQPEQLHGAAPDELVLVVP